MVLTISLSNKKYKIMTPNLILAPSLMCADLVNLESSVHQLEKLGFHTFHIDIIDSQFAPSMPLGLDTVARLRTITDADFDIHLMSVHNGFFIPELLKIGVQNITFHWESSLHVEHYLNLIHGQGRHCSQSCYSCISFTLCARSH